MPASRPARQQSPKKRCSASSARASRGCGPRSRASSARFLPSATAHAGTHLTASTSDSRCRDDIPPAAGARRITGPGSDMASPVAGRVAAPIRIADPGVARLLQAGDVVDVLAASEHGDGTTAPLVATSVRVVTVPAPEDVTSGLADGALIVVATTPSTAAVLARAAVTSRLSVTIRSS